VQHPVPDVVQTALRVEAVAGVARAPVVARGRPRAEGGVEHLGLAVGGVGVALDSRAGGVDEAGDVPVGVAQAVQRLVEAAVAAGVAFPLDQVVGVADTPNGLTLGVGAVRRSAGALLQGLPVYSLVTEPSRNPPYYGDVTASCATNISSPSLFSRTHRTMLPGGNCHCSSPGS